VRRGSTIAYANRAELDEMYSERYEERSADLHCEIISDRAVYADHRFLSYTMMGIVIEIYVFNRGNKRAAIKGLSVLINDEFKVLSYKIKNQDGKPLDLPVTLDEGEAQKLTIYLSLKELLSKSSAKGERNIRITLQDFEGIEISDKKRVEIT